MRPRVVLITGAPGSGKSTLGGHLAKLLRVPFLARDDIRGGLMFSAGAWSDELVRVPSGEEAVEVFLATVEQLLAQGVSCVVEYVVRSHRPTELDRIMAAGECVVIVTRCDDPMSRVVQRTTGDRLLANPAVRTAVGLESVEEHTAAIVTRMRQVEREMMLQFPVPVLHVDTTAEYDPGIEVVLRFAIARV